MQKQIEYNFSSNDKELIDLWIAYADARNYFLLGDPAAKLLLVNSQYICTWPEMTHHKKRVLQIMGLPSVPIL